MNHLFNNCILIKDDVPLVHPIYCHATYFFSFNTVMIKTGD